MSGHRQAAIVLHGLAEMDQRLILDQLPAADQAVLRSQLRELRTLGFEPGLTVIGSPAAVPPEQHVPMTAQHQLQLARAEAVFAILEHEPASLVAQVLAIANWGWSAGLLELFPPARREVIRAIRPALAPARRRFLEEALAEQLRERPAQESAAATHSVIASLRKWVRAWIR